MSPGCEPDTPAAPLACVAAEAGPPDPCCQPCWLGEECGPGQLPDFPNEARTRRAWREECELLTVVGECTSGVHFAALINQYVSDTRYFDRWGNFIGLRRTTDFDPVCSGFRYFPAVIECEMSVTEVICDHRPSSPD
jgi:hypothetical protein